MDIGDKIVISLPDKEPFEAIYAGNTFNKNLIRVKVQGESEKPVYGLINKIWAIRGEYNTR